MEKRLITVGLAGLLALGSFGFTPGPGNGNNTFGLCTAYFAGSETGQENKRKGQAFQGLEAAAAEADQSVEDYCAANGQQPGNGNGRP